MSKKPEKSQHYRPPAASTFKTKDGGEKTYIIHGITDTSEGFIVDFQQGAHGQSVTFPVRPPEREQMEYAHACARRYLVTGDMVTIPAEVEI